MSSIDKKDLVESLVLEAVNGGWVRFTDIAAATGLRLNVVWEIARRLDCDGRVYISRPDGGLVFSTRSGIQAAAARARRKQRVRGGEAG